MLLIRPSFEILTPIDREAILRQIELAGRVCYKSESMITEDSASAFVRRIIKSGHESVIEHVSISVKFVVDRGVTHELVRHRIASFSQESTRWCDYSGGHVCFVIPPWVDMQPTSVPRRMLDEERNSYTYAAEWTPFEFGTPENTWFVNMAWAEDAYLHLRENGWSPQQARSVLPNSLKTEIVATANLREWRHVLRLRASEKAHPQMREVMIPLLDELQKLLPEVFGDVERCELIGE